MNEQASLTGRVALITGASRGIGAAVARRFAAEGVHVILIARTVGGLEEVDDSIKTTGGKATLVPCDLTDFEAVDTLGPVLIERFEKLDIFVGNAGALGEMTPLTHYDSASWHQVFDINVHANWRRILTLDPLLRRSEAGRAILVTSGAAANSRAFWGAYAVAKAAFADESRELAGRQEQLTIVNARIAAAVGSGVRRVSESIESAPGGAP